MIPDTNDMAIATIKQLQMDGIFRNIYVPCPDCIIIDYDQETCDTCGFTGHILFDNVITSLLTYITELENDISEYADAQPPI